jgi:hypothetical protein
VDRFRKTSLMENLTTFQAIFIIGALCFVTGGIGGIAGALATHLAILPPARKKAQLKKTRGKMRTTAKTHRSRNGAKNSPKNNTSNKNIQADIVTDRVHTVRVTRNRPGQDPRITPTDTTPVVTPAGFNIQPSTFVRIRNNERNQHQPI